MRKVALFVVAVSVVIAMQVSATDGINLIGLGPVQKDTAVGGGAIFGITKIFLKNVRSVPAINSRSVFSE